MPRRTKKERKPGTKSSRGAALPARMSKEEVARTLRAPSNYEDLIDGLANAWDRHRSDVRVPRLSPGRLRALKAAARRAQKGEADLYARLEPRLRAAQERRLKADAAAWAGALRLWRYAKPAMNDNPAVARAFQFMADALSRSRNGGSKPPAAPGA